MLDMGFADNIETFMQHVSDAKSKCNNPVSHQVLLFSATMPDWINKAVQRYMSKDKVHVDLIGTLKLKTSENVKHYAIPSSWQNRSNVIGDVVSVYGRGTTGRTIIFVDTKNEANELGIHDKLKAFTQVIHGDIPQSQREVTLKGFREGKFSVLCATNVMARGLDIPEVDLVINCEPPTDIESYIHRSGRTGRAGRSGICVTFYKPQQESILGLIQRRTGLTFIKVGSPQPHDIVAAKAKDTLESLTELVHPKALTYFESSAQELLASYGDDGVKAVSAALAWICGTTKPLQPRSILSATEGMQTLIFRVARPIQNVGYVKSILQRQFPNIAYEDTKGWRMLKDSCGVIVDMVAHKVECIEGKDGGILLGGTMWKNDARGVTLELAKELPELLEPVNNFNGGFRGSSSSSSFNGNHSNGFSRGRPSQGNFGRKSGGSLGNFNGNNNFRRGGSGGNSFSGSSNGKRSRS